MIKDNIKNAKNYFEISDNLKKGFEWILKNDLLNAECKKYIIESEKVFANLQEYETKDDAKYEAHKKYIDIQYMVKGREKIGVTDINNCKTCVAYDNNKDIEFLDNLTNDTYEELSEGEFLILFPQDAHKPSIKINNNLNVKKVVVKISID